MKNLARIFKYLLAYKRYLSFYLLFVVLSIIFGLISLGMLGPFMQLIFLPKQEDIPKPELHFSADSLLANLNYFLSHIISDHSQVYALAMICIIIIVTILLKNLFIYLSFRMLAPMRNGVMTKLRSDLYHKVLYLPIGYFSEQKKGDLMSRMSNDTNEIEWSVLATLEGLVKDPLNIIILLFSLIFLSPKLSLFLLIFLPVMGFIIGRVSRTLKKQSTRAQEKNGESLSILEETLGGIRIIKAFTAEPFMSKKFDTNNTDLNLIRNHMNFRKDLASPLSEFLGVLVLCGVLWFGGKLVLGHNDGGLGAAGFITYIVLFTQIINPAKGLSSAYYNMQRGSAAIDRIETILNTETVEDSAGSETIKSFEGQIEFKNVSFGYQDVPILKNINLVVPKGKTLALVGTSGAGKSTLADLVPRFHDAVSGEILIDGKNIKTYSLQSLRSLMGIVTQEPILFNDTIKNNITFGSHATNEVDIFNAAKVANAYNYIVAKESGFETNIGDRGSKLSGGERQRLTIARAVYKNPPILILDEATSALDTESEKLVQDAINHLMEDRTSIVIAHRLSTIRHADEIVVLQKGEIVERGTHDQLLAQNGYYKRLVDMQEVK
ncbi:MAG: ABC transporter ATP-binding protein [Chitinophagaceae bacterium]